MSIGEGSALRVVDGDADGDGTASEHDSLLTRALGEAARRNTGLAVLFQQEALMQHCTTTSYGYGGQAAQTLCSTLPNTGLNLTLFAVASVFFIAIGYIAMTYKGKNA